MSMPELESISITDFRTIGGTITVPLDAPVVLIHGPNGVGKTSVLSALELALTGSVDSMRRTDPDYLAHLIHRGAGSSAISMAARGEGRGTTGEWVIAVQSGDVIGQPMLDAESARFFSERCYLAQSVLGRLLEIYQHSESHEDSPLTQFVNDLLGLDVLDALIDGLRVAMDVRNTRNLVPAYSSAERRRTEYATDLRRIQSTLGEIRAQVAAARVALNEELQKLSPLNTDLTALDDPPMSAEISTDESRLVELGSRRRDVNGLLQQADSIAKSPEAVDIAALESVAAAARATSDQWGATVGTLLEQLIGELRSEFPDLPSSATTDPSTAYETALSRAKAELGRCSESIAADDSAAIAVSNVTQAVEQARARLALLTEQLSVETANVAGLANALSALLPHIHNDDCPVCGRNYSEISEQPLSTRVASEITRFSERADLVTELSRARLEAESDVSSSQQQLAAASSRRLASEDRVTLQTRASALAEWSERLTRMNADVSAGAGVIRADVEARRDVAAARNRVQRSIDLRVAVADLCRAMSVSLTDESDPAEVTLRRLEGEINGAIAVIEVRMETRRRVFDLQRELARAQADVKRREDELAVLTAKKQELDRAFHVAEQRRDEVRAISRTASATRTAIVRQVFNQSLNEIWRDLFVRLAPREPYVPAFQIPEDVRRPSAQLITKHRSGGLGGSPGAMLSAGNLNTAALTLFLGLHLVAGERLPLLILDDPVQSMDEIHISQFAALLRTLSKEHGRRIVIAVHERPLFEYLALELSPAFDGDRLITVELKRTSEGRCVADSDFHHWQPDPVVEVA
jgi:exonuclease SbcC